MIRAATIHQCTGKPQYFLSHFLIFEWDIAVSPRLLPKEISKEPFGLLTSKVRSPSHYFRSPAQKLPWSIKGEGVG